MLRLENITGGYTKNNSVLKGIDLTVADNEVVAIVGQNGAGKSTLAKAIVNMIPSVSGNIYLNGELITDKTTQEIVNKGINFFLQVWEN
jgi:branched-chain amino acid transport system ATP-binding protein